MRRGFGFGYIFAGNSTELIVAASVTFVTLECDETAARVCALILRLKKLAMFVDSGLKYFASCAAKITVLETESAYSARAYAHGGSSRELFPLLCSNSRLPAEMRWTAEKMQKGPLLLIRKMQFKVSRVAYSRFVSFFQFFSNISGP